MTGYIPRWFTRTQTTVTHPSTNPAVHGRESHSRPVDHKSDALTTLQMSTHVDTEEKCCRYFLVDVIERVKLVSELYDAVFCDTLFH